MDKTHATVARLLKRYSEEDLLLAASEVMLKRVRRDPIKIADAHQARDFFRLRLSRINREEFAIMFLNTQMEFLHYESMFVETINQTSVYPREIIRRALELNSSAIILAHNHPSGDLKPSWADVSLTKKIKEACDYVGVQVMDHVIVSHTGTSSFAEQGLL